MTNTTAVLRKDYPVSATQAAVSWTQGVRDGWALAIDTLAGAAASMTCPNEPCLHSTEWDCAVAALKAVATYRDWD